MQTGGQRVYGSAPYGHETLGHLSMSTNGEQVGSSGTWSPSAANEMRVNLWKQIQEDLSIAKDSKSYIH